MQEVLSQNGLEIVVGMISAVLLVLLARLVWFRNSDDH
jgi:hypothetical protein